MGQTVAQHRISSMTDRKAVIKNADMSEDMQQDAIDCATQALEKYNIEKDIAAFIKKEFDKKYNPTWHCIVGRNFGSCAQRVKTLSASLKCQALGCASRGVHRSVGVALLDPDVLCGSLS